MAAKKKSKKTKKKKKKGKRVRKVTPRKVTSCQTRGAHCEIRPGLFRNGPPK